MERIEGLYAMTSTVIKEKENNGKFVISVDDMVEELRDRIDFETVPKEVLADYVLRFAAAVCLNDANYRSVIKGEGLYINLDDCQNPDFIAHLHNNAMLDKNAKQRIVDAIRRKAELSDLKQLAFDIDGMMFEEMTTEQLLEILKQAV